MSSGSSASPAAALDSMFVAMHMRSSHFLSALQYSVHFSTLISMNIIIQLLQTRFVPAAEIGIGVISL